ncbi:MAG: PLP-dependent aminotransferase family protein [Micropruina sp.]|uniref:MocR-like transcription factor YczR n=1 Tax=Micropruina sp. TaxID=2737536 RepID=UPI0039E2F251
MSGSIPVGRVASLVGEVPSPAFNGLASRLASLIADGLLPLGLRLPSERDLASALGLSRTTVTRAYGVLREAGYAGARQGSGTWTQVPGGPARGRDRALLPQPDRPSLMDLTCAAPSGTPGLASAYAAAQAALPAYLTGHGYFPLGLPELREAIAARYRRRGLPTTPEQILVTSGAIAAIAAAAQALLDPGDRALVESPVYPNAVASLRRAGARVVTVPVDPDGWDLDAAQASLRQAAPRVAYLIPDYQNPTGLLMEDAERDRLAAALARTRTTAIVDESHADLHLDSGPRPAPMAAHCPTAITVGGSSKAFWGGLRVGWLRVPANQAGRLTQARLGLDLGAPILEQLVLTGLLTGPDASAGQQRQRLRLQRDLLAGALSDRLPSWRFRTPSGGLSLWCELPRPAAAALALECERRGLLITPGSVFAPDGGLASFVRLPYTRPTDDLLAAVDILDTAWRALDDRDTASEPVRILIA